MLKKIVHAVLIVVLCIPTIIFSNEPQKTEKVLIDKAAHKLEAPDSYGQAVRNGAPVICLGGLVVGASVLGYYYGMIKILKVDYIPRDDNAVFIKHAAIAGSLVAALIALVYVADADRYETAFLASNGLDLHAAAAKGNVSGVEALLRYGFSADAKDADNKTPYDYAWASDAAGKRKVLEALDYSKTFFGRSRKTAFKVKQKKVG